VAGRLVACHLEAESHADAAWNSMRRQGPIAGDSWVGRSGRRCNRSPGAWDESRPRIMAVVGEGGKRQDHAGQYPVGLLPPSTGTLRYRGSEVAHLAKAERLAFRREVQAIAQDPFAAYNPFYTVDRALTVPIRPFPWPPVVPRTRRLIEQACVSVGLNPDDTLGRYPHQLSGGQRQRLMGGGALLLQPRLLVAGRTCVDGDASLRATILGNIAELNRAHGIAVVYITHDIHDGPPRGRIRSAY